MRDYGIEPQIWDEDMDCEHEWGENKLPAGYGSNDDRHTETITSPSIQHSDKWQPSSFCHKCPAWKGQLGLEPTFDLYIKHLCKIFDEIKRILKKTGTCWVNLGDTYAGSWGNYAPNGIKGTQRPRSKQGRRWQRAAYNDTTFRPPSSQPQPIQPKSLCQIPARFAIEMCNRGWILRNEIIWWKPNCMPSSAKDRFTVDFEKIFFFAKNKKYTFETQYEPWTDTRTADRRRATEGHQGYNGKYKKGYNADYRQHIGGQGIKGQPVGNPSKGRHKRSVWTILTKPFPQAHFPVYPDTLIDTPIKAGCPEYVCTQCGKPKQEIFKATGKTMQQGGYGSKTAIHIGASATSSLRTKKVKQKQFVGFSSCTCKKDFEPGIVLDPFLGSGTTALVALKLNRRFIGSEISQAYIDMAQNRIKPFLPGKQAGKRNHRL